MKRTGISLIILFLSLIGVSAQNSQEIKMFEKINKSMLKSLKSEHKASKIEVNQTESGQFYLIIKKKVGKNVVNYVANDEGLLIYNDPVDYIFKFKTFKEGLAIKVSNKWGLVSFKGNTVIPVEFNDITHFDLLDEGITDNIFHPATPEGFLAVKTNVSATFYTKDGQIIRSVDGKCNECSKYYYSIGNSKKGLYSRDGKEIYPQQYSQFFSIKNCGVIKCVKYDEYGVKYEGAKNIQSGITDVVVPCDFYDVNWDSSAKNFTVALHNGEDSEPFVSTKTYNRTFRDNGEKYWEAQKYEKVIEFYEGEGYGKSWGNYFMGMAAMEIAESEKKQMQSVIDVLNSKNEYYKPLQSPNNYKFNTSKALQMYIMASNYFEKYINDKSIPDDDPTKVRIRKLRGSLITAQSRISEMGQEYATAYSSASERWATYQIEVRQQQAAEAARNQQLSKGISSLIGNLLK